MASEPPVYKYLSPEEAGEGSEGEEAPGKQTAFAEVADAILTVLTWVALVVVLAVWAVVGALFWVPLMIRAVLRFSLSLTEATFEGQKPTAAAKVLRDAVSFYRRGFVVAVEVVTGEEIEDAPEGRVSDNRLLLEFLWALLVWYFIFLLFGWVQASPVDLVDWFFSIPWGQYFGDLVDRLTGGQL
jgi:hypothetical protein